MHFCSHEFVIGQRCGWNCLGEPGITDGVGEYTGGWLDGICPECWGEYILSERLVNGGVP